MFDFNIEYLSPIYFYLFFYLFGFICTFFFDRFIFYSNDKIDDNKIIIIDDEENKNEKEKWISLVSKMPSIDKFYVVIGLGGVGSRVVMNLIRCGVKKIRVIDYDLVTLSSLNRHAFAKRCDVGKCKSDIIKEYCKHARPDIYIDSIDDALLLENLEKYLIKDNPDVIIDCIDDLNTKAELFKFCYIRKLVLFSSMGAAGKCDPTSIRYKNFDEITKEPLARKLRLEFRKKMKVEKERKDINIHLLPKFLCVYSIEKNEKDLSELDEEQMKDIEAYRTNFNERVRTLPVFACMPSAFGTCLSSVSINYPIYNI